jgi:putative ABC transport system substrate-binding protein
MMQRREFITLLGGAAAWPLAARAQSQGKPVIGYIGFGALDNSVLYLAAFRKGLAETGFVEGQNVAIEYHWLEGRYQSCWKALLKKNLAGANLHCPLCWSSSRVLTGSAAAPILK